MLLFTFQKITSILLKLKIKNPILYKYHHYLHNYIKYYYGKYGKDMSKYIVHGSFWAETINFSGLCKKI